MLLMFVTDAVLNSGTVTRDEQPLNMKLMSVTAAVLNNGAEVIAERLSILLMYVTAAVLNNGTDTRL